MDRGMRIEVDRHIESFRFNEANLQRLLVESGGKELSRRAIRIEAAAKHNASQPHRAGPNTGSQPGGGPAVRTGRLRGSITWRLGRDALGMYADIGSSVFYAPFVELGTSRMAARPYLRPALNAGRV